MQRYVSICSDKREVSPSVWSVDCELSGCQTLVTSMARVSLRSDINASLGIYDSQPYLGLELSFSDTASWYVDPVIPAKLGSEAHTWEAIKK